MLSVFLRTTKTYFMNKAKGFRILPLLLVTFTAVVDCFAQPTNPATGATVNVEKNKLKIGYTKATSGTIDPDAYLIVVSKTNAKPTLTDGHKYTLNEAIGAGEKVVYYGTVNPYTTVDGQLDEEQQYYVYVFAANGDKYHTIPATGSGLTGKKGGDRGDPEAGTGSSSKLSGLLDFNFAGNQNGLSKMTPVIFYGWSTTGAATTGKGTNNKRMWLNTIQVGPYAGTTITIKDNTSYLPALMLPGNGGIFANYYLTLGSPEKFSVVVSPLNVGLKVISGFTDASLSLVQHNLRHSIGFQYADRVSVAAQLTTAWHNSSVNSEENFTKIFSRPDSKVSYWSIGGTFRLSNDFFGAADKDTPLYLSINLRSFITPKEMLGLPNARFWSVGLVSTLDLRSGINTQFLPKRPL